MSGIRALHLDYLQENLLINKTHKMLIRLSHVRELRAIKCFLLSYAINVVRYFSEPSLLDLLVQIYVSLYNGGLLYYRDNFIVSSFVSFVAF